MQPTVVSTTQVWRDENGRATGVCACGGGCCTPTLRVRSRWFRHRRPDVRALCRPRCRRCPGEDVWRTDKIFRTCSLLNNSVEIRGTEHAHASRVPPAPRPLILGKRKCTSASLSFVPSAELVEVRVLQRVHRLWGRKIKTKERGKQVWMPQKFGQRMLCQPNVNAHCGSRLHERREREREAAAAYIPHV